MKLRKYLMTCLLLLLAGCGGGGSGGGGPATPPTQPAPIDPIPAQPPTRTQITLQSDPGDLIGQGKSYSYSLADADIAVTVKGTLVSVTVAGDEQWTADFQIGSGDKLRTGTFGNLDAYVPSEGTAKPGLRWYGEGRGCSTSKGWFAIDSVSYTGPLVDAIAIRFERHCNGATPALRGTLHYARLDQAPARQPVPAPSDLWRPPADVAGAPGNYVYLESSAGDYVGLGKTYRYHPVNSDVWAQGAARISVSVLNADEQWNGHFQPMIGIGGNGNMRTGYYPGLRVYPRNNPTKGGLSWWGEGRSCAVVDGWFVIDTISFTASGAMSSVELRFEQRCEGRTATLRGAIRWTAKPPPVPVSIIPSAAGSWRPPASVGASAGNYLYLEGDPSGQHGYRSPHLHTSADAVFSASEENGHLQIDVAGAQQWHGDMQLVTKDTLLPGLYDGLKRYMYAGQPDGGISWTGEHRSCSGQRGWLAVDSIAYTAGKLSAIDLRFEQVCENAPLPMRGVLHWRADDPVAPPGPDNRIPAEAWRPAPELLPASGNYVYLESTRSDGIGLGANYRYTLADSAISLTESAGHLVLKVDGDEHWTGDFQTMHSLTGLQPGYYSGLRRYPFHNPARGGFDWSGEARGCNTALSSVIVDSVSYENGQLSAVQLRFEQYCEFDGGPLRGAVRWSAGDRTVAPGPAPIPATLWRPAAGAAPASGDYVYLQSDAGDFIGSGQSWLHAGPNSPISVSNFGAGLNITVGPPGNHLERWDATLVPMNSSTQLQVGFYDHLLRFLFHNPARGGFSWSGRGHGCNTALSWVAIDKVSYVNGKLTALHARFEQHCDYMAPALRGEIRWGG